MYVASTAEEVTIQRGSDKATEGEAKANLKRFDKYLQDAVGHCWFSCFVTLRCGMPALPRVDQKCVKRRAKFGSRVFSLANHAIFIPSFERAPRMHKSFQDQG